MPTDEQEIDGDPDHVADHPLLPVDQMLDIGPDDVEGEALVLGDEAAKEKAKAYMRLGRKAAYERVKKRAKAVRALAKARKVEEKDAARQGRDRALWTALQRGSDMESEI